MHISVRRVALPFVMSIILALATGAAGCNFDLPGSSGLAAVSQTVWSGDLNLGGASAFDPAITTWAPGRLDLFYVSSTGSLRHRWFQNTWSTEEDLGGHLSSSPAAVSWQSGRIDVFARGTDANGLPDVLMHLWFSNGWGSWESLGGNLTSAPAAASWAPGRLDVFYKDPSNALGHIWYDSSTWHTHEELGSEAIAGAPAAVSWSSGRLDVVARGTAAGGPLVHKWFTSSTWSGWETIGGSLTSDPAIASWAPGRLDIYYLDANGALKSQAFDGAWVPEVPVPVVPAGSGAGTYTGSPGATTWGGGRVDVVIKAPNGGVVQGTWLPDRTRDVLTQHNDNYRSGAALLEATLSPASLSSGSFGLLYSLPVANRVYAQPLYAEQVSTASGTKNLLYVATLENNIYAFDADSSSSIPVWSRRAGTDFDTPTPNDGNLNFGAATYPSIGILATPAIDRRRNALYVTDSTGSSGNKTFWLHALDLGTGADLHPPVAVGGTPGARSQSSDQTTTFDPTVQLNRPGLLLANGKVYVAFGSSMDRPTYRGWIFAHSADTLMPLEAYTTTEGARTGGGIWQSGNGLAADERGAIFFMSGNGEGLDAQGNWPTAPLRQEDSFVKLSSDLGAVLGQYWPHDVQKEFQQTDANDLDLGSGGPLLVPGQDVVVGGGKPGKLFVLDRGLVQRQASFQAFLDTWLPSTPTSVYLTDMNIAPNIHGSPVYWETSDPTRSYFYVWSEKDGLKAFSLDRHTLAVNPTAALQSDVISSAHSMPGGMLSLSANGTTAHTGIVWAVIEDPTTTCTSADLPSDQQGVNTCSGFSTCDALCYTVRGRFYAFDAEDLQNVLFTEALPHYSKMTPPTIANGKVVLATSNGEVLVYGLH